jgi:hypothetical protein
MNTKISIDPTETIKCDITQIPEKTIFDLYKLNLRNFCVEYLPQLTFYNIDFKTFKDNYISTVAIIDKYFRSITTDKSQKTEGGYRHFNHFVSAIIILCLKLDLEYKNTDEPEYEDLAAEKSEIGTNKFDLIMSMLIIYINNDYDNKDKKLSIETIISNGIKKELFKKYLMYGGNEALHPSLDISFTKYLMYKKKYLKLKNNL